MNGLSYAWDDEDRLTSLAAPSGTATFTYNGLGLRTGKTDPTGTYVCDGTAPGSPVLSDGHAVYSPGLSECRAGVVTYSDSDALGNLWTLDAASGDSTPGGCLYTAFGSPVLTTAGLATPFRYGGASGCQTDADTGLVLMGHRYYDSRIGRFLSQDPAGDGGNWYAYAGNDPVDNTDPEGLWVPQNGEWSVNGGVMSDAAAAFGHLEAVTSGLFHSDGRWMHHFLPSYNVDAHTTVIPGFNYWQPGDQGLFDGVGGAFGVGLSAVGSAASFHLWNGGAARHDPSFGVSSVLADIGVGAATAAFGGEAAEGASGCFTAGTPVQTQGGMEPIQDIHVGEMVATRDPQTGRDEYRKVVRTFAHPAHETVTAEFADPQTGAVVATVTATPEHPFYVAGRGFVALGSLGVGTQVVTRAGPALVVKSLTRQSEPKGVAVYNLEVEGDHTYFVGTAGGGLWVHNLCNAADIVNDGVVKGKILSFKQALDRIRGGLDVFAGKRSEAKALAKAASGTNRAIEDEAHEVGAGYFDHFHPDPRTGSHIFYP